MPIGMRGFGTPLRPEEVTIGIYFVAHGEKWTGLCLAIEGGREPMCLVLDYEGNIGDDVATPRVLYMSGLGARTAKIEAEQLLIQPRQERDARPFLAPTANQALHGSLVVLPSGDPVITVRHNGQGDWSLRSGKAVSSLKGGIVFPEWEIAVVEPLARTAILARFPEEEG